MALRILLGRDDFRRLVNGRTVIQFPDDIAVEIELDLDRPEIPPDPPEAREFLPANRGTMDWLTVYPRRPK